MDKIHGLTISAESGLELMLKKDDGSVKTLNYDSFKASGKNEKFKLSISGFKAGKSGLSKAI